MIFPFHSIIFLYKRPNTVYCEVIAKSSSELVVGLNNGFTFENFICVLFRTCVECINKLLRTSLVLQCYCSYNDDLLPEGYSCC